MTSAIFKSTGAIIIYILAGIALLCVIGYNYWGWFGGKYKPVVGGNFPPVADGDCCTVNPPAYLANTPDVGSTSYCKRNGKYYKDFTGGIAGGTITTEITESEYRKGCNQANLEAVQRQSNAPAGNILKMAMEEADNLRTSSDQAKIDLINKKLRENNITDITAISKGGNQPSGKFKSCNCGGYWYTWIWRSCDDFCSTTSPT